MSMSGDISELLLQLLDGQAEIKSSISDIQARLTKLDENEAKRRRKRRAMRKKQQRNKERSEIPEGDDSFEPAEEEEDESDLIEEYVPPEDANKATGDHDEFPDSDETPDEVYLEEIESVRIYTFIALVGLVAFCCVD